MKHKGRNNSFKLKEISAITIEICTINSNITKKSNKKLVLYLKIAYMEQAALPRRRALAAKINPSYD